MTHPHMLKRHNQIFIHASHQPPRQVCRQTAVLTLVTVSDRVVILDGRCACWFLNPLFWRVSAMYFCFVNRRFVSLKSVCGTSRSSSVPFLPALRCKDTLCSTCPALMLKHSTDRVINNESLASVLNRGSVAYENPEGDDEVESSSLTCPYYVGNLCEHFFLCPPPLKAS